MTTHIKQVLNNLPLQPGVYTFYDTRKEILYVGKAKKLKNRVKSYFQKSADLTLAKQLMVSKVRAIEYTITDTEAEALLLETSLIKKHKPPYNVMLKDDKYWQYIVLDYSDVWVQVYTVRRPDFNTKKLATYFGPYTSGYAVKQVMRLIKKLFPICLKLPKTSTAKNLQPCFNYHLGRCPGPCVGAISPQDYATLFDDVKTFLTGNHRKLVLDLESEMRAYSTHKQYESAARIRDQIIGLKKLGERQKVVLPSNESFDIISIYRADRHICVNVFKVRFGKLLDKFNTLVSSSLSDEDVVCAFIERYYNSTIDFPSTIITGYDLGGFTTINHIPIKQAQRGKKAQLLTLGSSNAHEYLKRQETFFDRSAALTARRIQGLDELARVLRLHAPPYRIETYDISNIQGTSAVGSMVVFDYGAPQRSDYRVFNITTKHTPDDAHMMREVLMRRLRYLTETTDDEKNSFFVMPDLIVVDGGISQLNTAQRVLQHYGLTIPVISLAKREEEIYVPRIPVPLRLPRTSAALQLLQHGRDEAHRFGISAYRSRHRKHSTTSLLDEIPGIGPVSKKQLLSSFSSLDAIKRASFEQLRDVVGQSRAHIIIHFFHSR